MWGFERVYDMNNVAGSSSNPRDPGSPERQMMIIGVYNHRNETQGI